MANVTPATESSKAKVNLRNLIAESSTFQTAIGAEGEEDAKIASAKARIHLTAYKGAGTYVRPFVIISRNGNDKNTPAGVGVLEYGGDLEVRFEMDIPETYKNDPENAELYFENFYETVMAECIAKGGEPGYFVINDYSTIDGPGEYEEEGGQFVSGVRLNVNWGLDAS